jgi:hypothetical protein
MKSFYGKHWSEHIRERICPRFRQFGELVLSRVLPAFEGINEEAHALERRCYEGLMSSVSAPEEDMWEAGEAMADLAFNEAMDHAVLLESMRYATINLYAAALYHLTEQHLIDLVLQIHNNDEQHNHRPEEAIAWFKDALGLDLSTLSSWPLLEELRLVANVVKHGEGGSAGRLRKIRPDLFVYPSLRKDRTGVSRLRMETTLFGQDFFVTKEEFERYHKGSVAFWTELADALPALTR